MNSFKHSVNERNKTNVLKLRMKHGAAGYGVYMMILERLAAEPLGRTALDYDILAYEFQEDVELIRSVIEDFDLFDIDLDAEAFSNELITNQMSSKAKQAAKEQILDEFIEQRARNDDWIDHHVRTYDTSAAQLRAALRTTFRAQILEDPTFPSSQTLTSRLHTHLSQIFPA